MPIPHPFTCQAHQSPPQRARASTCAAEKLRKDARVLRRTMHRRRIATAEHAHDAPSTSPRSAHDDHRAQLRIARCADRCSSAAGCALAGVLADRQAAAADRSNRGRASHLFGQDALRTGCTCHLSSCAARLLRPRGGKEAAAAHAGVPTREASCGAGLTPPKRSTRWTRGAVSTSPAQQQQHDRCSSPPLACRRASSLSHRGSANRWWLASSSRKRRLCSRYGTRAAAMRPRHVPLRSRTTRWRWWRRSLSARGKSPILIECL